MARQAGAQIEILEGDDPIEAILEFAHERGRYADLRRPRSRFEVVASLDRRPGRQADPRRAGDRRAGVSAVTHAGPMLQGKLKIYLGYAAGVGKTYQMLADAQELQTSGPATSSSDTSSLMAARIPSRRPKASN